MVASYGIGFSVFLITGGRLGDIFGRKRVFLLGLTGFTLASALCGLATTPTILIASRVLQALTAATLVPQVLAIIRVEFPAHERPLAIGIYGISMGFAAIGDVFFARLGATPNAATYCAALAGALSCNLVLQAATFLLVLLLRRVGRSAWQQRVATLVAPTEPTAADNATA